MIPKIVIGTIVLLLIAALSIAGLTIRRQLPFQEIIPLDKGIAAINAGHWYNDKLSIALKSDGGKTIAGTYDQAGFCIFNNLANETEYTVEIKRTDLKGKILYRKMLTKVSPKKGGVEYVVLVGASVGKSWSFDKLTDRIKLGPGIVLGSRTKYNFDKSGPIESLIKAPVPVTGVIIKECAAYFPRDIENSRKRIKTWVGQLRSGGIVPILATVVPVTKEHDASHPKRCDSLWEFNDFIRRYAFREKIPILDLEKALRISEQDRHLRDDYAQPDGLHLVKKAYYEALDGLVSPLLKKF